MGLHSSTMIELEAISNGLELMDILSRHDITLSILHIVTNSQAGLRALIGGCNMTELVVTRGGRTFPKSTEFRNSVAFHPFFGSPFPCFSVRIAESVS